MRYLRPEEMLLIHDEGVEKKGGRLGVRDMGLLCSIAERPKMAMMGREFYPDLFSKAAAYFEALAVYHVFTDGNKRAAFLVASVFLGMNGYDVCASNPNAYQFTLAVALKKKSIPEIAAWLKKHSKKIHG